MNRQVFNTFIILAGAALLIYSMLFDTTAVYLKIIGLVILMFGLYTATRKWVNDNQSDDDETE